MTNFEEHRTWLHLKEIIRERLSLMDDKADDTVIDERIRGDIYMKGSNLWILMFAIFVASIGLNVNSTAVIIGAMLISPLMGPIMGIGYGAGINDFSLLRQAFKNLAIATFIGLLTSTLYFLISPLDTAQSELLARTTPNVWDVLIGLFGGLAGIVAVTRKEKTNVIPGVAIATALMPPLCTAGFGLATGHWNYFFGAFYLYTINFVFIALSAFLIVRAFHIAEKKYIDPEIAKRAQRYIIAVAFATMLPSSYLAYQLVGEEVFKAKASTFVNENLNFAKTNVAQVKINPKTYEIKVFLIGEHISESKLDTISIRLSNAGLAKAQLKVYQNGERDDVDITTLKADIVRDLYQNAQTKLEAKEKEISYLKEQLQITSMHQEFHNAIPDELQMLFPKITKCILSETYLMNEIDQNKSTKYLILNIETRGKMTKNEQKMIEKWLKKRTKNDQVKLFF
ncbi:MAG: TIGR00341 family protein [Sulfuricurvum sp.]|uniref:TIGR00341 family protein n=1 Tax=Sulfuricurvum sp. TaxID=2025608 RepID=UPI0025F35886|nr:TIGR00341 family protein [Sulfuricurvum sp.]MBV5320892.1 TIGR00341 family protein [Sulfuricurvum sp.]